MTSTAVYLGSDGNLLEEKEENCKVLQINDPILTNTDILKIKNMKVEAKLKFCFTLVVMIASIAGVLGIFVLLFNNISMTLLLE